MSRLVAGYSSSSEKTLTGVVETQDYDDSTFNYQSRTFSNLGFARDVNNNTVGSVGGFSNLKSAKLTKNKRRKKGSFSNALSDYQGPWAKYSSEEEMGLLSASDGGDGADTDDEHLKRKQLRNDSSEPKLPLSTKFYGKTQFDYQGRTYMHIPKDLSINLQKDPGSQECFVPKKQLSKYNGHYKGLTCLKLFPYSGHLVLSGGNDNKILLWDFYHNKNLLRGYFNHTKSIKSLSFNGDNNVYSIDDNFSSGERGTKFLSCGFDKIVNVWDTEYGKTLKTFKVDSIPNCGRFIPSSVSSNELLIGLNNNNIEHYDLRIPENEKNLVQTYDHHLGPINSITFLDSNQKFLTTSDDKSMRVWDFGINIPIKFISDPTQYSMPRVSIHPQGKYFATQSMDNFVYVYQAHGKYRLNKKKIFKGHSSSGFAIDMDFSPDGKIILSGDNEGRCFFWDWKTCKIVKRITVDSSKRAITNVAFHPQEKSKVIMGGQSGEIYVWE
ncbi:Cdc40p [Ascoidea rubescens DSM 1968]|uniref:Pre-mRNA-processing factor 17 n=1 Tax=Ascoidea rubescens DSM 1968 TaxID=1344418 RepID=A0A1D2VL33_9ASCO|nr:WD40 repeat-like protein [Ascoidea rubescens DSM 1968]ODV62257.1 WD40 repeat-like protein [Ascoidea rubescens DSM 1968]